MQSTFGSKRFATQSGCLDFQFWALYVHACNIGESAPWSYEATKAVAKKAQNCVCNSVIGVKLFLHV